MKRIMQQIGIRPECLEAYIELHNHIWPELAAQIRAAHLHNYSIFHLNGTLTQYMEYTGENLQADMQQLSESVLMQRWCAICKTMQLPDTGQWTDAQEVFYLR